MEPKRNYTLCELFDNLPINIAEMGRRIEVTSITVARIRDGSATRRDIINRLLSEMSKIYGVTLNIDNVSGINIHVSTRRKKKTEEISDDEFMTKLVEEEPQYGDIYRRLAE